MLNYKALVIIVLVTCYCIGIVNKGQTDDKNYVATVVTESDTIQGATNLSSSFFRLTGIKLITTNPDIITIVPFSAMTRIVIQMSEKKLTFPRSKTHKYLIEPLYGRFKTVDSEGKDSSDEPLYGTLNDNKGVLQLDHDVLIFLISPKDTVETILRGFIDLDREDSLDFILNGSERSVSWKKIKEIIFKQDVSSTENKDREVEIK